jgi:hypothetical protein
MVIIYCDTDCVTFAIEGDLNDGLDQGFKKIIIDRAFWDKHNESIIADPMGPKRLLTFAIENIGDEMIATAPKNYILHRVEQFQKK